MRAGLASAFMAARGTRKTSRVPRGRRGRNSRVPPSSSPARPCRAGPWPRRAPWRRSRPRRRRWSGRTPRRPGKMDREGPGPGVAADVGERLLADAVDVVGVALGQRQFEFFRFEDAFDPVAPLKLFESARIAASRPRWSRTAGRRSSATWRTISMASRATLSISPSTPSMAGERVRRVRRPMSILRELSMPPVRRAVPGRTWRAGLRAGC